MPFHMTGIYQVYARYMTYGIYLVYTCHMTMFSYDRYTPGIFQVYTSVRRMSGIYQVYTIIINFQAWGFPSGILTTWYKRVYTCLKHVCTSYVQCLSTAADRHGIYKTEKSCTCFKHVHIFLQIHVHVCTWYVHGMYKGSYKRVCTWFKHVCTRL